MKGSPGVLSIYIRKLEILLAKAKVLCHFVWEGSGNMGCDLRQRSFSTLFSLFSRFGFVFFYSGFFSYPVKFYCNLLSQKFSVLPWWFVCTPGVGPFFVQSVTYKTDTSLTLFKLSEET